jgi:IS30 family transposase
MATTHPRQTRQGFFEAVRSGLSVPDAARAVGLIPHVARRWWEQAGGVITNGPQAVSGRYLSYAEREEIAVAHAAGLTQRQIAARIGRHQCTVSRELARGRSVRRGYRAWRAEEKRAERARRPKPAKLAANPQLRTLVQDRLYAHWSPEQISLWLRDTFSHDDSMQVSHETIYQSLYVQTRGALRRELTTCLRTGRALRHPNRRAAERRGRLPNMVNISHRPPEADDRAVPGHWEGDLIIGRNGTSAIGTLVERATRYVMLLHLPDGHTATAVRDALLATITTLPAHLRRSLTWDQGTELALHTQITYATGLDIYFCDPHSPWQRGTNENTNGLLRQYFPKGTDLSTHTREHLNAVAIELNARPRKTLGIRTPAQALTDLLSPPTTPDATTH